MYRGLWTGVNVAIKFLRSSSPDQLNQTAKEAILSRFVSHPNVVQVRDGEGRGETAGGEGHRMWQLRGQGRAVWADKREGRKVFPQRTRPSCRKHFQAVMPRSQLCACAGLRAAQGIS